MLDLEKRQSLTWRPSGLTHGRYGNRKVHAKQVTECIFPILIFFGAHILSFHQWI